RLAGEVTDALESLRDLAHGIYPPLLADEGLVEAIGAQARRAAVPVEVAAEGMGRYPQEVESAVYFCVLEALNNVAKYAAATSATIRLEAHDDVLSFTIDDDGVGFDPDAVRGTGLQGMIDRIDAVGGTVEIASGPGRGTSIRGRLPIPPKSSASPWTDRTRKGATFRPSRGGRDGSVGCSVARWRKGEPCRVRGIDVPR